MLVDSEQSAKYWVDQKEKGQSRWRVKIRYKLKLENNPILRKELKDLAGLEKMSIFRQPHGTNFPVTNDEWKIILEILKRRFQFKE
jgi:predicted RNA-binding protein with PUA-like domain